jgi:hypothetical protein
VGQFRVANSANPNTPRPSFRGKRGEAFGSIERYYGAKPSVPLTVAMWQDLVKTAALDEVDYSFLAW